MLTVSFTVQYPWESPRKVSASADEMLSDILADAGYVPIGRHELLAAVRGHFVSTYLSAHGCGITDGTRVVVIQRHSPSSSRAAEFLQPGHRSPQMRGRKLAPAGAKSDRKKKATQLTRMVDQAYLWWEIARQSPTMYLELHAEQQSRAGQSTGDMTVTNFRTEISEDPLPAPMAAIVT